MDLPCDVVLRLFTFVESPSTFVSLQQTCRKTRDIVQGDNLLPLWLLRQAKKGSQTRSTVSCFLLKRRCTLAEAQFLRAMVRHPQPDIAETTSDSMGREVLWQSPLNMLVPWLACSMATCESGTGMLAWLFGWDVPTCTNALKVRQEALFDRCVLSSED